jgi:ribulose-phosphate 3-epimerase
MVEMPEAVIDAWLRTGLVKRVIVHLEAMTDPVYILEKCERFEAQAMLAINPGTDATRLLAHTDDFKYMQILAVYPGLAGQKFKPEIIEKIKFLKAKAPNVTIEVDGGINLEIVQQCKDAGAEIFVSASYILSNENPRQAFESLKKV